MSDYAPIGFTCARRSRHFDHATRKLCLGRNNMCQDTRSVAIRIDIIRKRSRHEYILHCSVIKICDDTAITRRSTDADKRYVLNYAVCADCAEQSAYSDLEILNGMSATIESSNKSCIGIGFHHSERNVTFRRFKFVLQIQVVCQKHIAVPSQLISHWCSSVKRLDVLEFFFRCYNLRTNFYLCFVHNTVGFEFYGLFARFKFGFNQRCSAVFYTR